MKRRRMSVSKLLSIGLMLFAASGCAWVHDRVSQNDSDERGIVMPGTPPTLSKASVSPNPAAAGNLVTLTANYSDPDADLRSGLAIVLLNGQEMPPISFRTLYSSGIVTLPVPISSYARASQMFVTLKIRDDCGNWSNAVSAVFAVE